MIYGLAEHTSYYAAGKCSCCETRINVRKMSVCQPAVAPETTRLCLKNCTSQDEHSGGILQYFERGKPRAWHYAR